MRSLNVISAALLLVACPGTQPVSGPSVGNENGPCFANQTCFEGFACEEGLCVRRTLGSDDAGEGSADAGRGQDGGAESLTDAGGGPFADAGVGDTETVDPGSDGGMEPSADSGVFTAQDGGNESVADSGVEPAIDGGLEPPADVGFEPVADIGVVPVADGGVVPVADGGVAPVVDGGVAPVADGGVEPAVDGGVEPVVDGGIEPAIDGGVDPVDDGGAEPVADGGVEGDAGPVDPVFQFRAVLTWDSERTDMDLHLLRGVNPLYYRGARDCHYQNCKLNNGQPRLAWGAAGPADDPALVVDDTDGLGPEVIRIESPEAQQIYTVGVHYFADSVRGRNLESTATIEVFVGDREEAVCVSEQAMTPGQWWMACQFQAPENCESLEGGAGPVPERGDCGDGELADDEACDDGNDVNTDACTNTCDEAACGDGIVRAGLELNDDGFEACDDGNQLGEDGCDSNCQLECGNGEINGQEACDDGNDSNNDACLEGCVPAQCGDGFEYDGEEECDDGNQNNEDDCVEGCLDARCGDGFLREGVEECDDGDEDDEDDCTNECLRVEQQEVEPNDSFRQANLLQTERNLVGRISGGGRDVDTFRFEILQRAEVTLRTLQLGQARIDTILTLYNRLGQQQAVNDDEARDVLTSRIVENLEPGIYYVRVSEYGSNNEADYGLQLSVNPIRQE